MTSFLSGDMATPMDTTEAASNETERPRYVINYNDKKGHGAFGIVYGATSASGQKVACKVIDYQKHEYPEAAEAEAQKWLQIAAPHPNIVDIYAVYKQSGNIIIAMEDCVHGNLAEYLMFSKPNLPLVNRVVLMAQIADGLKHLHSLNIIHRDIKPQNIVIQQLPEQPEPVAKITDFGLIKFLEEMQSTAHTDVGTHAYKAPEFWRRGADGKLHYRKSIDIYAAGLTFLAILQTDGTARFRPHIEQQDSLTASEVSLDIGYTMSVRMKHNQPIPNIVQVGGEGSCALTSPSV